MAVVFDAVGPDAAGLGASSTTLSWSHTCAGSNLLLTVAVGLGGSDSGVTTTVTYNGVSMTSAGKAHANNQPQGYTEMFYLVSPAIGTNTVIVTASASRALTGGSVSFAGVDQVTPVSNVTTGFGDGGTASVTVSSATDNMVVSSIASGSEVTASANTLQWRNNFSNSFGAGNGAESSDTGASSVLMSFSLTSDWWGMVGMSLNAAPTTPAVTTQAVTNPTNTTATGNGTVVNDGGSTVTDRGMCWSTTPSPTTADNTATDPGTVGSFSVSMIGLSPNTLYYVRAYATNANGTSYGQEVTFLVYPVNIGWIAA